LNSKGKSTNSHPRSDTQDMEMLGDGKGRQGPLKLEQRANASELRKCGACLWCKHHKVAVSQKF
jgi:hypothetical protein